TTTLRYHITPLTSTQPTPLSLHDALPISRADRSTRQRPLVRTALPSATRGETDDRGVVAPFLPGADGRRGARSCAGPLSRPVQRSEEHTSELQSRENLVCRLLLEKKNYNQ